MILLVDDDPDMRGLFEHWFKGYDYIITQNADEAYSILRHKEIKLLVTDFALHERLGSDLALYSKEVLNIPSVVITGHTEIAGDLCRMFQHIFIKPVDRNAIMNTVKKLLDGKK